MVSNTSGTATNTDTWKSFRFCCIYLNPSQKATVAPLYVPYKNVIVHSNVWCIGKNDNNVSVLYIFTYLLIATIFEAILFCDNITAFGSFVVPDVNSIIDILYESIFTLSYLLSPFSNISFPFSRTLS